MKRGLRTGDETGDGKKGEKMTEKSAKKSTTEVIDGETIEVDEDEDNEEDDYDDDDDEHDEENGHINNTTGQSDLSSQAIRKDRITRLNFRTDNPDGVTRVLFVVPSEPLVWQVAAYFAKLLKEEGEDESKVAIVTSQMAYYPPKKFNVMPPIVVGTPLALESALTKCRGLVGRWETVHKAQGDLLPGGFDHFDWVIYDEGD